ncbi:MAG: YbaK/EbsC family protein [Desulfobacterales bacterium]|nr:YbaK/EbsC family protein [Desulfobacterales bacterium]MCU0584494.1 YbaK/EbsC family protein [Desulfobacterales bacterium]
MDEPKRGGKSAGSAGELSPGARRVQASLTAAGLDCNVVEMAQTTRSAQDAARAVGCTVGQIAKSLLFQGAESGEPLLVITSGANRVDEARLAQTIGEPVRKADAELVRRRTGFAIGGVPPVGHTEPLRIFIDEDLLAHPEIWAAAGTPQAVFKLTPQELQRITGGKVVRVK